MIIIGTFQQLLIYVGFALGIFPLLAVIGLFIARARRIGEEQGARMWGFPVIPAFYILSTLVLMAFALHESPFESIFAIVTVCSGIVPYFWISRLNQQ
jgi:APA family basic amino acid/polyamine antiporter